MTRAVTSVDIIGSNLAEVLKLLRQEVASGRRVVLIEGETPVADVSPSKAARNRRSGRAQRPDPVQSLSNLVGIGTSPDGATEVSSNKLKYLADACANLHGKEK